MTRIAGYFILACALTHATPADAHILPAGSGTIRVASEHAQAVLSVPLDALPNIDDNQDGRASLDEVKRHETRLIGQVTRGFSLADAKAETLDSGAMIVFPGADETEGQDADHIVVLYGVLFSSSPQELTLTYNLFGESGDPVSIRASRSRPDGGEDAELIVLRPGAQSARLFEGPFRTGVKFVSIGIEHILKGLDHLLFLLTIVAAGVSLRHWIAFVSAFTIAHSITLTMAMLGIAHAPAAIVEPMIAASIVGMALYNLLSTATAQSFTWRICAVFACGLMHGLGFASSLADIGVNKNHLVPTLIGFNLGIEIGQAIFVACVLLSVSLIRHLPIAAAERRFAQAASAIAGVIGVFMIIDRAAF